ncbi:pilus assembly protein PilP [Pseudobacteriovorax antillogorgiicola]|uniref:Pilus assembly protein, PilP n=1 Tax=Pseudobacteriovorax antillogorgiicola TaxID=1513793 RepID=A0A1Y6BAD2_9BACT|nr:pilus assembly protein PilP [Pseudobacteriovorax antillogorgiicola]TCS58914.1 pilus assembly protein PilP [Pseudobacteriovorax antillogorgiicola]SME93262.1 Pilus assembly protein, PilP [Pseudobacteriovorax antillogorgiicola]
MGRILAIIFLFSEASFGQAKVDVLDLSQIDLEEEELDLEELEKDNTPENDALRVEDILEPSGDYQYASFGRPDPFARPPLGQSEAPLNEDPSAQGPGETAIPILSPLQAYPLEQLQVKGVWVHRSGETRAVVMTPKKEGIVIKEGDPISAGKVIDINRRRVLVRQYSLRADGTREFKDVELGMGKPEQEQRGTIRLRPGGETVFEVNEPADQRPVDQGVLNPAPAAGAANPLMNVGAAAEGGQRNQPLGNQRLPAGNQRPPAGLPPLPGELRDVPLPNNDIPDGLANDPKPPAQGVQKGANNGQM